MRVLVRVSDDAPSGGDILRLGDGCLVTMDGKNEVLKGRVFDTKPAAVKQAAAVAAEKLNEGHEASFYADEWVSEVRRLGKSLAAFEAGDVVDVEAKGSAIVIPQPEREVVPLAVGDVAAFNDLVSPQYLMNARVTITAVAGERVSYEMDEGDVQRLRRAGKNRGAKGKAPREILDKVS